MQYCLSVGAGNLDWEDPVHNFATDFLRDLGGVMSFLSLSYPMGTSGIKPNFVHLLEIDRNKARVKYFYFFEALKLNTC